LLYSRYDGSPWAAEARYGFGWACWNQKQYDNAVNALGRVAERGATELAARAQLLIGLCRLEQKRYAEAVAALAQVPSKFEAADLSALALVEAARAHVELKQRDQAEKRLEQVLREYPRSKWAEVAKSQMKALNEGKALPRPELLADPRILVLESNPVGPIPLSVQAQNERAPLEDPTSEVSFKAAMATPTPERNTPAPFLRMTLPEPFEHHLPPRVRIVPAEDPLPIYSAMALPR
jgi:TolA-binding protein